MPVALLAGILGLFAETKILVALSQVMVPTELVEIVQYIN